MFHCPQTASPPNRNILRRTLLDWRFRLRKFLEARLIRGCDVAVGRGTLSSHRSESTVPMAQPLRGSIWRRRRRLGGRSLRPG